MTKNFEIKTTFRAVDKTSAVIGRMQSRISRFTARTAMAFRGLDRSMSRIGRGIATGAKRGFVAATGAVVGLGAAVKGLMTQFSKVEDAQAAFTPVLGGAEKAKEMVKALNDTAATTPFQFENLSGAAKQLLPNMGGDIAKTIETIRMLGDTAGGNAQKMDSIVRGYNKALLKGKVDMESLNMIAEAGVPIFNDLGTVVGKTGPKLFKAISAGKVSTEDLTKVFQKMTGEGGIFYRGMEIASETLSGRVSTLKDVASLTAAELGETLAPTVKELVIDLTGLAKQGQAWIKANKGLIRTKVTDFIKKIPKYLEEISYWGGKLVKYAVAFYSIAAAIKVARGALFLFNAVAVAANTNIGGVVKSSQGLSNITKHADAGTRSIGKLQAGFYALGAFMAGWEIGTIIYDKIVDPLMKAQFELENLINDVTDTMSRDLSKRSVAQLNKDLATVDKTAKALGQDIILNYLPGLDVFKKIGEAGIDRSRKRLEEARSAKIESTTVSKSESRESVEVTIKDTTGRAKVTRGKTGRRIKLRSTAVMP